MEENITIFCLIAAAILCVSRLALSWLEEKDRAAGMMINKKDYKFSHILMTILKDWASAIGNFFVKIWRKIFRKKK